MIKPKVYLDVSKLHFQGPKPPEYFDDISLKKVWFENNLTEMPIGLRSKTIATNILWVYDQTQSIFKRIITPLDSMSPGM